MKPAAPQEPTTLAAVLFDTAQPGPGHVAYLLTESGACSAARDAMASLDKAHFAHLEEELSARTAEILRTDLTAWLLAGWLSWRVLKDAARYSLGTTEMSEVELGEHRFTAAQTWSIEIYVYGCRLSTIGFTATLVCELSNPRARIRAGRLVGLSDAQCDFTVRLEMHIEPAEQKPSLFKNTRSVDLRSHLSFGAGIPLLQPAEVALLTG